MSTKLKRLECEVIALMRAAIASLDTDLSLVSKSRNAAHELFADHLLEWSEEFAALYNRMLAIYRQHTPLPTGKWRDTSIGIGFSSFPIKKWRVDKVQPVPPTSGELLERFDALIQSRGNR